MSVTFVDQFCGAGGSTTGAVVAGLEPVLAMNHWRLAIETHSTNYPGMDHACVDVASSDPRAFPRADVLLTSPECRAHSYARGRPKDDPTLFNPDAGAEKSRATMWDVPRFAEIHRYEAIVVENVVQAVEWGPKDNKGSQFRAWLYAMDGLGYDHRIVSFNSMFAPPTPQSRDRMYVVFWRKGARAPDLDFTVTAWCEACGELVDASQRWKTRNGYRHYCGEDVGRYGAQYDYACPTCTGRALPLVEPAASAIDWDLPAERIGDRKRPLADATMARIRRGLDLLGRPPMVVQVGGQTYERPGYTRAWATTVPIGTVSCTPEKALVVSNMAGNVPTRAVSEPAGTVTTGSKLYLLVAPGAFVVPLRNGSEPASLRPRSVTEPLPTQTTRQELGVAVIPLRRNGRPQPADRGPVDTVCADGNHHGLLVSNYGPGGGRTGIGGWERLADQAPIGTIKTRDGHSLVLPYHRTAVAHSSDHPMPTMTTVDPAAVVHAEIDPDDCGFRMLEPHEIARAMQLHEHPDGHDYVVHGTKRDRVRQYGNAVTPPVMTRIAGAVARALEAA